MREGRQTKQILVSQYKSPRTSACLWRWLCFCLFFSYHIVSSSNQCVQGATAYLQIERESIKFIMNAKYFLLFLPPPLRWTEKKKWDGKCTMPMPSFQLDGFGQRGEREKTNFTDNISKIYTVIFNARNNFSWQMNLLQPGHFHQDIPINCRDNWKSQQKHILVWFKYVKEEGYETTGTEINHWAIGGWKVLFSLKWLLHPVSSVHL